MFGHLCTVKDSGFSERFMSDGIDLIYDCRACAGMQSKFSCFPLYGMCSFTRTCKPHLLFSFSHNHFIYQFLLEVWLKVGLLEID